MELPTVSEELNRKTIETLEWLATRASKGFISEAEFSTGVDAMFGCTAGLVPRATMSLFSDACSSGTPDRRVSRTFYKAVSKQITVIRWIPGGSSIEYINETGPASGTHGLDPTRLSGVIQEHVALLTKIGFVEV